ncbi:RsmB/NOP family class I SAM-dependent RNA methyltransferase [Mesorhizobium sp. CAU 1741]|uniref:RsmB/NOP family class I SAM-dependent RNA methyltransferase n=1 Tax=Mesorhizobium sp. CAU 1741 TaxID=3140366 RepID=UPI00325BB776
MRLGGRVAAAIEILDDIENRHRPAADALKDWGLSHRFAGAGDRAAIGNVVYDALRRRRSAAWLFDDSSSRALAFGALLLEWGMNGAGINAMLEGDRFAPAPLTSDELATLEQRDLAEAPAAIRADCPDWCIPLVEEAFGDEWPEEVAALAARPPLDLRVNTLLSTRDKVLGELSASNPSITSLARDGIRIPPIQGHGRHPNVQAEPAFQKGWFEVQDEGSQLVGELADATPGMQVLDYCAGAGGKTLALSAAMENRGQIFAHDSEKQRLAPIFDRLRRAGARNVQTVSRPADLEPLCAAMDLVLVDAPCTGSGTWRRRPDAKWRLTDRQLDVRLREQAAILAAVRDFVKPGGRLVYITCSIFPQENRHQMEAFLNANQDFRPLDPSALWNTRFPGREDRMRVDGSGVVLTPRTSGTDGFFFAALERVAG